MADLSNTERELVAIGAAIASNCIPCAEFHIAEGRKLGLTDSQLVEAVRMADKVRQVPAQKVLRVALSLLSETDDATRADSADKLASASQEAHPCCR